MCPTCFTVYPLRPSLDAVILFAVDIDAPVGEHSVLKKGVGSFHVCGRPARPFSTSPFGRNYSEQAFLQIITKFSIILAPYSESLTSG